MTAASTLADAIGRQPHLRHEQAIFASREPDQIADRFLAWCEPHIGPVNDVIFYRRSAGIVVGLRVHDDQVPHDPRFDFDRTSTGAEWIDTIASEALSVLRTTDVPDDCAHFDWRVENLAFRGEQLVGVFDWASIGRGPEAVAVGQSSAHFTTDWRVGHSTLPTLGLTILAQRPRRHLVTVGSWPARPAHRLDSAALAVGAQ